MPELPGLPTTEEAIDEEARRVFDLAVRKRGGRPWDFLGMRTDDEVRAYVRGLVTTYMRDVGRLPPLDPIG